MSRVSRVRTALVAAVGATLLAVGATAAPAQAATGTITYINGGDYDEVTWTNPEGGTCRPVGLHSYGLTNNTDEYVQVYANSSTCIGSNLNVGPGGKVNSQFMSIRVLGS